jgi:two-component system, sensor histidine kinase
MIDIPRFIRSVKRGGLSTRLFFLAFVPCLIAIACLGWALINSRLEAVESQFQNQGEAAAQRLALAASVATQEGQLLMVLQTALSQTDTLMVSVQIGESSELLELFKQRQFNRAAPNWVSFVAPIQATSLIDKPPFRDMQALLKQSGHATVGLDRALLTQHKNAVWRHALSFGLPGLFLLSWLMIWQAKRLSVPLKNIVGAVEKITAGEMSARVKPMGKGELRSLELGINEMAKVVADTRRDLEARIDAATRSLKEQRDEATRASTAKSRFLASASHDLRQPMHALGLFCTALAAKVKDPEQHTLINNIQISLRAMEGLFETLLDMSRLDAGRVQANVQPVPLADMLAWVQLEYADAALDKGLRFRVRPTDVWVQADVTLLRRVLMNFAANAIRYTPKGGILITARLRKGVARIEVWDTGIGIARDQQAHVFDEFVQVANPERDRTKGLGLGLSIAQKSAQLMGTTIELVSRLGVGSRFSITLPAMKPALVDEDLPKALPSDSATASLMGRRIALVEDDEASRDAMDALFQHLGCLCVQASSGDELLAKLTEQHFAPEIIISDYRLRSNENGLDVVAKVRKLSGQHLPAIIVTGELEFAALAGNRNEQWVLKKPVSAAQLRLAIQHALAQFARDQVFDLQDRRATRLIRHASE